ncbi:hypothetical protein QVM55_12825 [Pseudomonas monteilii]|uniref:type II toxin-antitoxin system HicB family antitoxin n=1 Tax=Pseudomonas TaxID=286 RepID=UPI003526BF77
MYDYAIRFEKDTAPGLAVYCRDLPQLNSYGDDQQHAISEAVDAIETTLSIYVDERRVIPRATPAEEGEVAIRLPAVTVAKIILWNEMMVRDMRKADLCRLLGLAQTQGDRLVDFLHTSKMEVIEGALQRLNVKLKVEQQLAQDPFDIWINLPESRISAGLTVRSLVDAFGENRELVVGKSNAKLGEVKEHSVDYILRQFAHQGSRDTRQATIPVIDAIVASGAFRRSRMIDPVTRREVDSIAIL